jgi:hypothetical protein
VGNFTAFLDAAPGFAGEAVQNWFQSTQDQIQYDRDSRYFVDYLRCDPLQGHFDMKRRFVDIYHETADDLKAARDVRLAEKLEWLKAYVMSSMEGNGGRFSAPCGEPWNQVRRGFPRTEENLASFAA